MVAHPVAVAADVDDMAVVHEAVDERSGHDFIAQYIAPFLEAFVGGEDRGGMLVATVDELEDEHGPTLVDRQIPDLIHHQKRGMSQLFEVMGQLAGCLGFFQRCDQIDESSVVDTPPALSRCDGEADPSRPGATPDRTPHGPPRN